MKFGQQLGDRRADLDVHFAGLAGNLGAHQVARRRQPGLEVGRQSPVTLQRRS